MSDLSDFLSINFFYKEGKHSVVNEPIQGKIVIEVFHPFKHKGVHLKLNHHVRGQINSQKITYRNLTLSNSGYWSPRQEYTFDINIDITEIYTYKGINLDMLWALEIEIEPEDETKSILRKHYVNNVQLINLLNSYGSYKEEIFIDIYPAISDTYQMLYYKNSVTNSYAMEIAGSFLGIIAGILILKFADIPIFIGLGAIGVAGYFLAKFIWRKLTVGQLGKITYTTEKVNDDEFQLELFCAGKTHNVEQFQVSLTVDEIIEDKRGTTDRTLEEVLYISEPLMIEHQLVNEVEYILKFPERNNIPVRIEYPNSYLKWYLLLEVEFRNGGKNSIKLPVRLDRKSELN